METEEKVIEIIKSSEDGILQKDLWKDAGIDRRKCSRIIDKLKKDGIITRNLESGKGSRTYRIRYLKRKKEELKDFSLLLVENMFAPCTGCTIECFPERCMPLTDWIFELVKK
ncbi:MAG: winged helix-turn-helix transcriptional regulator [Candidatus Methanoperedens sp.]|jgi:DNA-binding MarR family transcriptional regulator|nr:winged helix-turn-helix transcriptional regulator [Candidatus Methanoperedens sp.]PKL54769.1 MAG: MarR family transcriptional regulator [Candidatus Methanoperedenaceae archaeon HGW-Methanoperedenaceae-1]